MKTSTMTLGAGMHLNDAVNQFIHLAAKRYSPCTLANYRRYLYLFADFLPAETHLRNVTPEHLERFLASLNVKKSTLNTAIIALKSFFRLMHEWTDLPNPAQNLKKYKVVHYQRFLTEEEYSQLLSIATPKEHAILQVLSNTGLRVTELLNTNRGDIQDGMVTVIGKGKMRSVSLNNTARTALNHLFGDSMNLSKNLKSRNNVTGYCYRLSQRCGLKKFSPHSLRRLFANRMRRDGCDLYLLAKLMGHSSVRTLEKHYLGLDESEIRGITDFMDKK